MADDTYTLAGEYDSLAILDQKVQCFVTTELSTGNVHFEFSLLLPVLSPACICFPHNFNHFIQHILINLP
jgi:hypothetical protein